MEMQRTGGRLSRSRLSLTTEAYMRSLTAAAEQWEIDLREIRDFYEGEQIEDYGRLGDQIAKRFREMFLKYPACNLVKVGVSTIADRLAINSITAKNAETAKLAQAWWDLTEMRSWQLDLYRYLLRDSMAVVIASWDATNQIPIWTVHELFDGVEGNCRVHWDSDGNVMFVSKRWVEHDANDVPTGRTRITVYYEDQIERYVAESSGGANLRLMTPEECQAEDPNITANPEIWIMADGRAIGSPAVVFYNNPFESEAEDLMTPQTGVNESILSWHVAGRYGGFRMLVMENASEQVDKDGNPIPLRVGPGRFIRVRSQGTQPTRVYPIPAEDVGAIFEGAVMPYINLASMAKRWPVHVFNTTSMPSSGELVRMLEGSLVAQCDIKKPMLEDSWRELFEVTARMGVVFGRQPYPTDDPGIEFVWKPSETKNEQVDLDVIGKKKNVGNLPDQEVWRLMGYTAEDIARLSGQQLEAQKQALKLALAESIPTQQQ